MSEHGVYVKTNTNEEIAILCLYMDGFLITSNNEKSISKFKSELMKEFEMSDLDIMTYFLGIEFHKSKSVRWSIIILSSGHIKSYFGIVLIG